MEIVASEVKGRGYADSLSAGMVLSGGGSLIRNTCPLANEVLGMDAKIGRPLGLSGGLIDEVNSPLYATAVGLVIHALKSGTAGAESMIPASNRDAGVVYVNKQSAERLYDELQEV